MKKKEIVFFLKEKKTKLKKSLGQNYLIDKNILQKISAHIYEIKKAYPGAIIIEIGSGLGSLTEYLLNFSSVLGVEIDKRNITFLKNKFKEFNETNQASLKESEPKKKLFLIEENIIEVSWNKVLQKLNLTKENLEVILVGNLPYHFVLKIIEHFSENYFFKIQAMVFLMQKEVALRLTASTNSQFYGIPTLFAQYHWQIKNLLTVGGQAFFPIPKVVSELVAFLPAAKKEKELLAENYFLFKHLVKGSFFNRRKKIINSLRFYAKEKKIQFNFDTISLALKELHKDETLRGEELSLKEFIALTNRIELSN